MSDCSHGPCPTTNASEQTGDAKRLQALIGEIPQVFDVWAEHMRKHPNDAVLSDTSGNRLARKEVEDIANRVNAYLRERSVGREDMVLIRLDRGVKPVIAAMGVWKAGAAFCLVESDYAEERIAFISKDCGAKVEISEDVWQEVLATAPVTDVASPDDHDAAMCVYTSGTTGTPKGVLHEYGQIRMEMLSERLPDGTWRQNRKTKWGLGAPLNFMASLKILVHFLYCGGHLHVLDYDTVKNPNKLDSYFLAHRINSTFLAPTHIRMKKGDLGPLMKCVYVGAAPANNISLKHGELLNCYTMTESFFTVTNFPIDRPYEACPLGAPLFDLGIRLLDEEGNEAAPGELGEIAFPNPYCRGYMNLPEENAARFVNGLFRTKDLASFENGVYTMRGRADDMVKINGNRVEPLEIEAVFNKLTGIDCVVKCFIEDADGFVALYYVSNSENDIEAQEIRERMESKLPYYMIPSYFVPIDKIPTNSLGKVDRKALRKPIIKRAPYVAPATLLEERLCQAATKVLGVDKIGTADDLFELGATSIDIVTMMGELSLDGLTALHFYRGRTVAGVAEQYNAMLTESNGEPLSEEEKELEGRKHRYFDAASAFISFMQMADPDLVEGMNFTVCLRLSRLVNIDKLCEAINTCTSESSTFKTKLVLNEQGLPCYEYAPHLYKPIVVERMTDDEVESLQMTFVQPHKIFEELPWRIRVIRTRKYGYLFFDIHHALTDAAGVRLMLIDIINVYQGKEGHTNNLFAWEYDLDRTVNSPFYLECKEKIDRRLEEADWSRLPNSFSDDVGVHVGFHSTGIKLEDLNTYLKSERMSRGDIFAAAMALTLAYYTKKRDVVYYSAIENRFETSNIAGMRVRGPLNVVRIGYPKNLQEYLNTIKRGMQEAIATSCVAYYDPQKKPEDLEIYIDDTGDVESVPKDLEKIAKRLDLPQAKKDSSSNSTGMPIFLVYRNEEGELRQTSSSEAQYFSNSARTAFVETNNEILRRIIAGDETVLADYLPPMA